MGLLLFYIILALGVSFLCSVMEAVLLSVTPSYIAMLEQKGSALGAHLKEFKADVDRPLAAILSLNTIAHTIGAAGAGAQAAVVFKSVPIAVFSAVLTLLILVFSEIIPKTLGALYWQSLVPLVVRLLRPMIVLLWPLVKISQGITHILSRGQKQASMSRDELHAMAELVGQEGVIEETESLLLKSILRFGSLQAKDVMTPRSVLFALQEDQTIGTVLDNHPSIPFSRLPVYSERHDDIDSYILKDEMLRKATQDEREIVLKTLKRPFTLIPEDTPLLQLFDQLIHNSEHIALVVDPYGGVSGIVSMEDVIETMLGLEIVDEADKVEDMQELAREQWRKRAQRLGLSLDKLHTPEKTDTQDEKTSED